MAAKNARHEDAEQVALFQWRDRVIHQYPGIELMHAIPNGGKLPGTQLQRIIAGKRLKAMGLLPGVADIFLPVPRGNYHGLYLEMKKSNGVPSDVSIKQLAFSESVRVYGYSWEAAFGWEDAMLAIKFYYGLPYVGR